MGDKKAYVIKSGIELSCRECKKQLLKVDLLSNKNPAGMKFGVFAVCDFCKDKRDYWIVPSENVAKNIKNINIKNIEVR